MSDNSFLPLPLPAPFRAVTSTRLGGVSPPPWDSQNHAVSTGDTPERVLQNARTLSRLAGVPGAAWARVQQVHGAGVVQARGAHDLGEADALWTEVPNLPLAIRVADCASVVLAHPASGRLGIAHAGWRGAAVGVCGALIEAMGVDAGGISAVVSPHLGACCFEVGEDVLEAFGGKHCKPRSPAKWSLDLGGALEASLVAQGVAAFRITRISRCTSCEPELFFSHRRDHGQTGRMVTLAWRNLEAALPDVRLP